MKKLLLILLLLMSAKLPAQIVGRGHGGSGPWLSADTLKFFQSKGTLKPVWTTLSNTSFFPDSSGNTAKYLQVLAGGGFGWATPTGGSPYFKDDGGTPVRAPTVTAATKGFAIGDSAVNTADYGIAWGNNAHNTAIFGIAIGSTPYPAFSYARNSGKYGTAIGAQALCKSYGSVSIGYSADDECTSNVDALTGGGNIVIGETASNDTGSFNTLIGFSATSEQSRSCLSLGDAAYTKGVCDISIGSNSGTQSSSRKSRRIFISSVDQVQDNNASAFDSTTMINGLNLIARNSGAYYFGYGNTTGSTDLFVVGAGGVYGNASTFNALRILRDGTTTIGKDLIVPSPTVPASAGATGVAGQIAWDSGFIYICTATNTWKRVAIATW